MLKKKEISKLILILFSKRQFNWEIHHIFVVLSKYINFII